MTKAPALFIAHGAPSLAIEQDDFTRALGAFGTKLDSVKAVVVVSAHWQTRGGVRVNGVARPAPIYDFGGFSDQLYTIRYGAPGLPDLAVEIVGLLSGSGISATLEEARGWDHGLWVPLLHLLPRAEKPVVEVSLPYPATPAQLIEIGRALSPLRDRNVAICGSGGIVHNLRLVEFADKAADAAPWAQTFDGWVAERLTERDTTALEHYRDAAPNAQAAVPTPEHFEPLLVAVGASRDDDALTTIYEGFHYATLSMRSIAFM